MYAVENYSTRVKVADYIREYVNVEEFLEKCKECPNYGKIWSCPPFDFDPYGYWKNFSELEIKAKKIIFKEPVTAEESRNILTEIKDGMTAELYESEGKYPGSISLSAGSCSMCREKGCTRPDGKACRHCDIIRYSIEAIGGDVGRTVSRLLGIDLEWVTEGEVPSYFVLVGGLLKK